VELFANLRVDVLSLRWVVAVAEVRDSGHPLVQLLAALAERDGGAGARAGDEAVE
jgi:hypothetical protein